MVRTTITINGKNTMENGPIQYNFISLGDSEMHRNYNKANQDRDERKVTKTNGKSWHMS